VDHNPAISSQFEQRRGTMGSKGCRLTRELGAICRSILVIASDFAPPVLGVECESAACDDNSQLLPGEEDD
jgi:hypothetical protein